MALCKKAQKHRIQDICEEAAIKAILKLYKTFPLPSLPLTRRGSCIQMKVCLSGEFELNTVLLKGSIKRVAKILGLQMSRQLNAFVLDQQVFFWQLCRSSSRYLVLAQARKCSLPTFCLLLIAQFKSVTTFAGTSVQHNYFHVPEHTYVCRRHYFTDSAIFASRCKKIVSIQLN